MKRTTKYRLYAAWLMAVSAIPLIVCLIPMAFAAPFEWALRKLCRWRDNLRDRMAIKLRIGHRYDIATKKIVIIELYQ